MHSAIHVVLLALLKQEMDATYINSSSDSVNTDSKSVRQQTASKLNDRLLNAQSWQSAQAKFDDTMLAKVRPDGRPSYLHSNPMKNVPHPPFVAPLSQLAVRSSNFQLPRQLPVSQARGPDHNAERWGSPHGRWPPSGKGKSEKMQTKAGSAAITGYVEDQQQSLLVLELEKLNKMVGELTETAKETKVQAVKRGIDIIILAIAVPVTQIVPGLAQIVAVAVAEAAKAAAAVAAAAGNKEDASDLSNTAITAEKVRWAASEAAKLTRGYAWSAPGETRALAVAAAQIETTAKRVQEAVAAAAKVPPAKAKAILLEAGMVAEKTRIAHQGLEGEVQTAMRTAASKMRRAAIKIRGAAGVAAAAATAAKVAQTSAETQEH